MLTLSRGARTALFALNFLSKNHGRPATAREIADAGPVSRESVVRVLQLLRRQGLVQATPGVGFELAVPANHIGVLHVLQIIEGPMQDVCLMGRSDCHLAEACPLRAYCTAARDFVRRMLTPLTIDRFPADADGKPVCLRPSSSKPPIQEDDP